MDRLKGWPLQIYSPQEGLTAQAANSHLTGPVDTDSLHPQTHQADTKLSQLEAPPLIDDAAKKSYGNCNRPQSSWS